MSDQRAGGIAWTDETWNPIRGCSAVSPGCGNCYAETMAGRFSGEEVVQHDVNGSADLVRPAMPYAGLVEKKGGRWRWTGKVAFDLVKLLEPLRWKRPRRVFVNSMSDLFHEALADDAIAAVFGVMAACPQHQFQVLTKRADRMLEWFKDAIRKRGHSARSWCSQAASQCGAGTWDFADPRGPWPLPNVWLGVSVENQSMAAARVPKLLKCPAAIRWVSAEPLLDKVDLNFWLSGMQCKNGCCGFELMRGDGSYPCGSKTTTPGNGIDWVVVGGESGSNARDCFLGWVSEIVKACQDSDTPVFVKQLGTSFAIQQKNWQTASRKDRKGADMREWPKLLQVREYPGVENLLGFHQVPKPE